jgi:prolyl-tRNA synthetase
VAKSISPLIKEQDWEYEDVYTPQKKTVKEVSDFLNIETAYFIKSLLFMAVEGPVLVLIRGDQELHEKKLAKIIGQFRTALKEEALSVLGVETGFIGPMGHKIRILSDHSLKHGTYITGANKTDYHTKGVKPNIHFKAEWHDLHIAKEGDNCHKCNALIKIEKVIEIGNIFKLGTKYSIPLNAVFLDKNGEEKPMIMGSYGIGPARIAAAAIEQNHDRDGIIWPKNITPFDAEIIPLNINHTKTMVIAEKLYSGLKDNDIDVLIDDRDERPGVKFKDADLIGIPIHIIVGEKALKDNLIEIKNRRNKDIKKISVDYALKEIANALKEAE